jgi:hypothetical protein
MKTCKRPVQTAPSSFTALRNALIHRKCACGGRPGVDDKCDECRKKELSVQRVAVGSWSRVGATDCA